MAVSKIAVMALVGILAVPILLGYALNLSEVTETDYEKVGDSINVTQLLQNGTDYTYSHADPYRLNTNFSVSTSPDYVPIYESKSSTKTTYYLEQITGNPGAIPPSLNLYDFKSFYLSIDGADFNNYLRATIVIGNYTYTYDKLISVYYDGDAHSLHIRYYSSENIPTGTIINPSTSDTQLNISYTAIGNYTGSYTQSWEWKDATLNIVNGWVDFSAGFHFSGAPDHWYVLLPDNTLSVLFTINLDSITDNNYSINFGTNGSYFTLTKTTNNGLTSWKITDISNSETFDLYYDQSSNKNTYQIYFQITKGESIGNGVSKFTNTVKFNYVGAWPKLIGKANSYWSYDYENVFSSQDYTVLPFVTFYNSSSDKSPIIRFDDALFRAFEYPVIQDSEFNPATLKDNPTTKLENITKYGASISFAGNTYNVDKDGNITMGTHKIPLKGMEFESVPVPVGYENRINGDVISTSAEPSVINFNGSWAVSVSVTENVATTYTKTEWIPGQFAWDGIDTNFLIVGLITCLGVFIALGIYVRKSGKGMIPLILVCGGAVTLFICMI